MVFFVNVLPVTILYNGQTFLYLILCSPKSECSQLLTIGAQWVSSSQRGISLSIRPSHSVIPCLILSFYFIHSCYCDLKSSSSFLICHNFYGHFPLMGNSIMKEWIFPNLLIILTQGPRMLLLIVILLSSLSGECF